jgi:hypothetical protein
VDCQLSILSIPIRIRKAALMKDKRFVLGVIALFMVVLVVAVGWIALNTLPLSQSHALYDYSDASASLPRNIMRGGSIRINWWGYSNPDLYQYTKPKAYATLSIELTVLLIPEATFRAHPYCSQYPQTIVLDEVKTDNRTGASWYMRVVTIPHTVHPGAYELIRMVTSSIRSSCFSNTIYVSA